VKVLNIQIDDGKQKLTFYAPGQAPKTKLQGKLNERVPFRLIETPCCGLLLCWINPHLPRYCPHCGHGFTDDIRSAVLMNNDAWLRT
jgi:hypothetical protein